MPDKICPERAHECERNQGHYYNSQNSMTGENRKIQRSGKPLASETRGAVLEVIDQIRTEEKERNSQG